MNHEQDDPTPSGDSSPAHGPAELCRRFDASISDLLLADLDADTLQELTGHREQCERCAREWAAYSILVAELHALPDLATADQVWRGLERCVSAGRADPDPGAADWSETAESTLLADLLCLPYRADPTRVWRRLEGQLRQPRVRRAAPWRRPVFVEVAALTLAAALLVCVWVFCNGPALAWAEDALPGAWSGRVAALADSPYHVLFVPVLFAAFAGMVSMASLPLLMQAIRERPAQGSLPRLALAVGPMTALPSGEPS